MLLDRHDGKMRLSLRVLVESEADTIACACVTRPEVVVGMLCFTASAVFMVASAAVNGDEP